MFPYKPKLLRCDPVWSQLVVSGTIDTNLTIGSNKRLTWKCSECDSEIQSRVQSICVSTGRCKQHASKMNNPNREHYNGDVPKQLLRPIRAGLLQSVDIDQIIALIATLEPIPSQCITASASVDDPAAATLITARGYVESIIAGNYTRVQLLDSVFWGDDTVTRKDGRRYIHPPRPKKRPAPDGDQAGGPAPLDAGRGRPAGCAPVAPLDVARIAAVPPPAAAPEGAAGALVPMDGGDAPPVDGAELPFVVPIIDGYTVMNHPHPEIIKKMCKDYLASIHADLAGHWVEYATRFLFIPVPLGGCQLSLEHMKYCYCVLRLTHNESGAFREQRDRCLFRILYHQLEKAESDPSLVMDIIRSMENKEYVSSSQ